MKKLGLTWLAEALQGYWPRSGPRWDGLATAQDPDGRTVGFLLVEGKSYPEEMFGRGCQSPTGSPNRILIESSLATTKAALGPARNANWTGRLYQSANRLAHVQFLRASTGMPAWLVNLCFTLDPRTPWTERDFRERLKAIKAEIGLDFRIRPSHLRNLPPGAGKI